MPSSAELVYRGRPQKDAARDVAGVDLRQEDVEQLCSLFPGRLGRARARRLLQTVAGDVDVALAVLMDEEALFQSS
jgi:hypothetical protein